MTPSGFDPVRQTLNNVTRTLINVAGDGNIGTSVPPKLNGEFRVPFVNNLRLGPINTYLGGTEYTLLWDEPDDLSNVSHFNIYVVGALSDNDSPIGPYSSKRSPGIFRVVASTSTILTFFVQTQLSNGNCSEISRSPSVTAPSTQPDIGTIPASGGGTGYTSYTNGQILIGNTSTGALDRTTLTAGVNMTVTNGAGSITLGSGTAYRQVTGSTSVTTADFMLYCTGAGAFTLTLPTASDAGAGRVFTFPNLCAAAVDVALAGGDVFMGGAGPVSVPAGTTLTVRSNGLSGWVYA